MATIYRFIVEQKVTATTNGRNVGGGRKTTGKSKSASSFLGSPKGGVEHNRKMRAINPLMNKITGGIWEKGWRASRAVLGIGKSVKKYGAKGLYQGPALYIIIAMVISALLSWQSKERQKSEKLNAQNYKQLENGVGAIHGQYKITQNVWNGRYKMNENK